MLQGISLKKGERERDREREREREREKERKKQRPELWQSRICSFIFKRSFYTLSYTFPEVKDTKSCRVNSTFHQFYLYQNQDIFCIAFHKQGSYVMYIIFWPCGLLTFCNSFLIKVGQPENLLSLYLSSCSPPQETELHSYGAKVQWVTRKKELIN